MHSHRQWVLGGVNRSTATSFVHGRRSTTETKKNSINNRRDAFVLRFILTGFPPLRKCSKVPVFQRPSIYHYSPFLLNKYTQYLQYGTRRFKSWRLRAFSYTFGQSASTCIMGSTSWYYPVGTTQLVLPMLVVGANLVLEKCNPVLKSHPVLAVRKY